MARLRLASVEYKRCPAEGCGVLYEGERCPACRAPFDPEKTRRLAFDRLILVGVDPAIYERAEDVCRCTACGSLFHLSEGQLVTNARCPHAPCGRPLLDAGRLAEIWEDARTLLQKARRLTEALRGVAQCPHCQGLLEQVRWCPLCGPGAGGDYLGLPEQPTAVWVRTFHRRESLDEVKRREAGEEVIAFEE
jgi:hypothetical protein